MKLMQITTYGYQTTLDEILDTFEATIYRLDANTPSEMIVVVDPNGYVYATYRPVDNTPNAYELYDIGYKYVEFAEVARLWCDTLVKLA